MQCRNIRITFSDITFDLIYKREIVLTDSFLPFSGTSGKAVYRCFFEETEKLPEIKGELLEQNIEYQIIENEKGIFRRFIDHLNGDKPYAVTEYDWKLRQIIVSYLPEEAARFASTRTSLFHLGWEKVMISEGRMLLHASCIDTVYGGLLFSGISGAGKSTQADLWCRYQNAVQINGDRPVLCKQDGKWKAFGSPYAGSSRYYVNADCDVRAVFMVKKALENKLRLLNQSEAFRALYRQVIVNDWDADYVCRITEFLVDFVNTVPVCELQCTADEQAVKYLCRKLEAGYTDGRF